MDSLPGGSKTQHITYTKRTLVEVMLSSSSTKFEDRCAHLQKYIVDDTKCPEKSVSVIKHKLSHFTSEFKAKFNAAQRKTDRLLAQNKSWLDSSMMFTYFGLTSRGSGGRPSVDFSESSERSKRRKTEKLRSEGSTAELVYAAQMSLRAEGSVDSASLVKEISFSTPTRAQKYHSAYRECQKHRNQLSGVEALSVLVEAKLTRHQYDIIRQSDKEKFPSYKKVQEAKQSCYPNQRDIKITETIAEVTLQSILDHTVGRIMELQKNVLEVIKPENLNNLVLLSKWGCDGSSGQSRYKQKFQNEDTTDSFMFATSFVPLQLVCGDPESPDKIIVWQNPRPSSPRFCRPIRLQVIRETAAIIQQERDYIQEQVDNLTLSSIEIERRRFYIKHTLMFTMIDGKVCNAVTSTTSTQRCYICGATINKFNEIDSMLIQKTTVDPVKLTFGLSPLHARIRFFECLLHVAYRLPFGSKRVDKINKILFDETKKRIQDEFKCRMGLLVDQPKPGFGNTNDGNTARRFFENAAESSTITGIDINLIERFHVILQTISSGFSVDKEKFQNYAIDTARIFVDKYPWYSMPPTLHKVFIHGSDVIASAILPIGQLSEEAQEALNKEIKKFREGFARKSSRQNTMEDVFNRLLLNSDPVISSLRKLPKRKTKSFHPVVLELLSPPAAASSTDSADNSEEPSSDEDVSDSDEGVTHSAEESTSD